MQPISTKTQRNSIRANTYAGSREHSYLLMSMQRAARRQENMLKELHSGQERCEEYGVCSQEMLGEVDIGHGMDFNANFGQDVNEMNMCLEEGQGDLPLFEEFGGGGSPISLRGEEEECLRKESECTQVVNFNEIESYFAC